MNQKHRAVAWTWHPDFLYFEIHSLPITESAKEDMEELIKRVLEAGIKPEHCWLCHNLQTNTYRIEIDRVLQDSYPSLINNVISKWNEEVLNV